MSKAPSCWATGNGSLPLHHIGLVRARDNWPRRPAYSLPANAAGLSAEKKKELELYWGHFTGADDAVTCSWGDLVTATGSGFDIGVIPWVRGHLIIDCDVKEYYPDGRVYQPVPDGVASAMQLAQPAVKKGIDDLSREVMKLGHSMAEVATYTVRTKSGGYHLHYRQNPAVILDSNRHFRKDWRVDVICSKNSWCAEPPTAGYEVVRDLPIAMVPAWLAEFLRDVNQNLEPVGGRRARELISNGAESQRGIRLAVLEGSGTPRDLLAAYVTSQVSLVSLADECGGWNMAIFQCACDLLEIGYQHYQIEAAILEAARPRGQKDTVNAKRTIASACAHKSGTRCGCDVDEHEGKNHEAPA